MEIGTTEPNGPGCNLKPQKSTKVNTCSQPIGAEVDPTEGKHNPYKLECSYLNTYIKYRACNGSQLKGRGATEAEWRLQKEYS